jgi:hypothetical protein
MKVIRSKLAHAAIAFSVLAATAGADLAPTGQHVLAGGLIIKAGWTPLGQIEVAGAVGGVIQGQGEKVQIYEYADGSNTPGAVHYAATDASGSFDISFAQGVSASKTDTIQAYDSIYGWSNPVSLPSDSASYPRAVK